MNNYRRIFLPLMLSVVAALSACAGIAPEPLESTRKVDPIQLAEPYEFISEFPGGARIKNIVASGSFVAVSADANGIYYRGTRLCYSADMLASGWALNSDYLGKTFLMADCGVFIPTNSALPAKIFTVIGTGLSPAQVQQQKANTDALAVAYIASGNSLVKPPMASGLQAGAGAGLGFAIVGALADAENGRFDFVRNQEESPRLRVAISKSVSQQTTVTSPP